MKESGLSLDRAYPPTLPITILDRIGNGSTTASIVDTLMDERTWGIFIDHNKILACLKDLEQDHLTQPPFDRTSDYTHWRWHVSEKGRLLSPNVSNLRS